MVRIKSAIAVEVTNNSKTGPCSATHATQHSCSDSCPLKPTVDASGGCYANTTPQNFTTVRLNRSTETDILAIAREEADAIRTLSGKLDLRIHVVGDCDSNEAATIVSTAAREFELKHGRNAWTYTHSWRHVDRSAWLIDNVLASCETPADVRLAWSRGYSAELTVDSFYSTKAYMLAGIKVLPCPEQTQPDDDWKVNGKPKRNCVTCRLCLNPKLVASRIGQSVIGLSVHGNGAKAARNALAALNN